MSANTRSVFLTAMVLGLILRAGFVLLAGNQHPTFLSGGSDAPAYILLANNLLDHKGFSYAGQPTAFRPPGYPLFVAGAMAVFGHEYLAGLRWLQFFLGLLTAAVCARVALRLFGYEAAWATFVVSLFLPTLTFSTAQVLTECLCALLTALFLLFVIHQHENADPRAAVGIGLVAGLELLIRFNAAALPVFAVLSMFRNRCKQRLILRTAAIVLLPLLIVLPWFIRNQIVFRGQVLYSTHGGPNAVQGVVSPQGRTQPGDTQKLQAAMGWNLSQLETNDPKRLVLPSEVELNRHALGVIPNLWRNEGWNAVPLLLQKIADFWLSTDQLLDTKSLSWQERLIRAAGVLSYWVVLAFAVVGLLQLRKNSPDIASMLFVYAAGFTVLHFPFVMNTRLRIPLMDPLVVILAGEGLLRFVAMLRHVRWAAPIEPTHEVAA
jgi:4-amino-4-deoxy-L-arabinose transferase-like glycosyltransferase